jgi:hypothetical protein
MWDLWWTKWHWDRFFSEFFGFSLSIYHSTVVLQTHIIWGMPNMLAKKQASMLGSDPPHLQEKKKTVCISAVNIPHNHYNVWHIHFMNIKHFLARWLEVKWKGYVCKRGDMVFCWYMWTMLSWAFIHLFSETTLILDTYSMISWYSVFSLAIHFINYFFMLKGNVFIIQGLFQNQPPIGWKKSQK